MDLSSLKYSFQIEQYHKTVDFDIIILFLSDEYL